jgi:hypothetical protein
MDALKRPANDAWRIVCSIDVMVRACLKLAVLLWISSQIARTAELPWTPVRQSDTDLRVGGRLAEGLTNIFIPHAQLRAHAKTVTLTVTNDLALKRAAKLTGLYLDDLWSLLPARPEAGVLFATCTDKYHAWFTREYARDHRPILVLEIDGQPPAHWPKAASGISMAPYYVAYESFVPKESIAGQLEHARYPYGVEGVEFRSADESLSRVLIPNASGPVLDGQRLALRECLSCHFHEDVGGTMSARPWIILATWAKADANYFRKYVLAPRSVQPASKMPGFPDFNGEALDALVSYFRQFPPKSN